MSVAAMTLDDQRPLMNTYDSKMSKQYEQNLHIAGGASASGPASPTPSGSEEVQQQFHHQIAAHHHHHHHHQQQQQQQQIPHHTQQQQQFHHRHAQQPAPEQQLQQTQVQQSPPSPLTIVPIQQQQQQQQLQQQTTEAIEQRQRLLEDEIEQLKLEKTRLSQQCTDAQRREKILMRRLANKELEFQDYVSQIAEYKAAQAPSALALRSALLDPAVNLLFEKLKKELKATKAKLEETQNELSAWKFTPDSNTGKRLMAKCRLLYQENEELGKMTSNGRLAKLETELAMQKSFSEEVKKSQSELDDFLQELDEDVEGMQSTILFLQQELKTTRDRIQTLEKENVQLKNGNSSTEAASICKETLIDEDRLILSNAAAQLNGGNDTVNASALTNNITDYSELAQTQSHAITSMLPNKAINELNFTATDMSATATNSTQLPLETIDENACLRNTQTRATEFYGNGSSMEQQQQQQLLVNNANIALECTGNSNSNCSNNGAVPAKLRTAASRKRNYENELIEHVASTNTTTASNVVVMASTTPTLTPTPTPITSTYISTAGPRTLPPKKSKLRRTSVQSLELNDNALQAQNLSMMSMAAESVITPVAATSLGIVDNVPTTIVANEEMSVIGAGMLGEPIAAGGVGIAGVEGVVVDGGVAQRILMRRRSILRPAQQNGSFGDSNH